MPNTQVEFLAVPNIPLIQAGDDLPAILIDSLHRAEMSPQAGDVLVISSKIISKAQNCFVQLDTIEPSPKALALAEQYGRSAPLLELILRESTHISRITPYVVIVRHRLGFTSANAGIDASNIDVEAGTVLLLPQDPDADAAHIRAAMEKEFAAPIGVIISDTHGRPFRFGNIGMAIGVAGFPALDDQRGNTDLFGRVLEATIAPMADEVAAAAGLISGQADEGQPLVLVRGIAWQPTDQTAQDIIRPPEQDLYYD